MPQNDYEPGVLHGPKRDPTLSWEGLRSLDDTGFGKLFRALTRTAGGFIEAERAANDPRNSLPELSDLSDEARAAASKAMTRHENLMQSLNGFVAEKLIGMVQFADIDPNATPMYSQTAIFKESEPVLYFEHWGTTDLDDPASDPYEFQMFVGLNGHLKTDAGKTLAHSVLDKVLDGLPMSPEHVPSTWQTLGTVPVRIFEPFVQAPVRI